MGENLHIDIVAGSSRGNVLGFTKKLFLGLLIYDDMSNTMYIMNITSLEEKKGNVTRLYKRMLAMGFNVCVVNPVHESMNHICFRLGFKQGKMKPPSYTTVVTVWYKKGKKLFTNRCL